MPAGTPVRETVHFLLIHLIGLFADSPFTVSAVYFFLGFPLAALTMYWLMRQAGIGRLGSGGRGPSSRSCRAIRRAGHLWLSSYWVVPGVWLVLQAAHDRPILWRPRDDGSWRSLIVRP